MRGSIESRGIHYKEDSRFIPARKIGNLETNTAEADLSPTTFTSSSASDPDYDISTEDSSEDGNENTYTEASSDNSSSDPETKSNAKSEVRRTPGVRQCQRQSQSRSELDQVVIPRN